MVFSSVPVYLDPPNWQQQTNHHQAGDNQQQPPPACGGGGSSTGSIRSSSMADRARLAKLPQPEVALKCPRCESSNTKFCYFNNYSLTQPRHFCKTCRRYWTRGGALRNVPVGGGCRRNKRSKGSSSKSPVTSADRQTSRASTSSVPSNSSTNTDDIIGHMQHQLPFMPSLHNFTDYIGAAHHMGLNFGGIQPSVGPTGGGGVGGGRTDMDFQMVCNSGGSGGGGGGGGAEQWRLQQFPFLAGLEPPPGMYPFEGEGVESSAYAGGGIDRQIRAKQSGSVGIHEQMTSVKMEENQGLNLSREFLGISSANDQYNFGGNTWTDLSGFTTPSSTSHLL